MKIYLTMIALIATSISFGQYTTPGTGVNWNLTELAANSSGSINSDLVIIEDITISLNDSITITDPFLKLDEGVKITVFGDLNITNSIISGVSFGSIFEGFRLEESADVIFNNNSIHDCGGIKVITPNFVFENNEVSDCPAVLTSGGFIELSNGKPVIRNNEFGYLQVSAISSAANSQVAPIIDGNIIQSNVQENSNRPQINLGTSGASDTTMIINNQIMGSSVNEMVGGVAFSSLVGGEGNIVIENNIISNNRYGIAILGNGLTAFVNANTIVDNNTQNLPNLGGSGINLNGNTTSFAVLSNNTIEDNLWGVTVQGTFSVAMGDNDFVQTSPGGNSFRDNGNGGNIYALFNNTPNEISAMHNCWDTASEPTLENAESVISHVVDDSSLGEVIFDPMYSGCGWVGLNEYSNLEASIEIYPNPTEANVTISWPMEIAFADIELFAISGQSVPLSYTIQGHYANIETSHLKTGIYLVNVNLDGVTINKKLTVK